jgi:hypothetical protein
MILLMLMSAGLISSNCDVLYQQHMQTDMTLSYQQFDQTMDSGFRPLAQNCKAQAIELIKNYIILNQAKENSMRWHIAQLSGEIGRVDEAIKYAQLTLKEDEQGEFKWNDYVAGYIAYWRKDIPLLQEKINLLESHTEHQGNAMNAKLLKSFLVELQKN